MMELKTKIDQKSHKLYTAVVTARGDRDGHVKSSDGILEMNVHKPYELGGQGGATNPEQLFAAVWGPSYLTALGSIAENDGTDISRASVDVRVSFNQEGDSFFLSAELDVHIPGMTTEAAQKLANRAHIECPYSKATRGNIETRVTAI
jgi:lipoyl-dependent peroxiredoxin